MEKIRTLLKFKWDQFKERRTEEAAIRETERTAYIEQRKLEAVTLGKERAKIQKEQKLKKYRQIASRPSGFARIQDIGMNVSRNIGSMYGTAPTAKTVTRMVKVKGKKKKRRVTVQVPQKQNSGYQPLDLNKIKLFK